MFYKGLRNALACCLLALGTACSGLPPHPEIDARAEKFSARRARAHFAALAGLGERPRGSENAARARAYVERELGWAGAEVEEPGPDSVGGDSPVLAWLPGSTEGRILVVAPWSPALDGAGPDDSGVATLLELARALSRQPSRYSVGLAVAVVAPPAPVAGSDREAVRTSGAALVESLRADGQLESIRAVLVLEPRVGTSTRIARDLRSHPVFRDLFWRTAARLGHGGAFPEEGGWSTPEGVQGAFLSAGYGRVLSLVDEGQTRVRRGRAVEDALVLPEPSAFEPVGAVAYEGLLALMARLARVDAFSP
ncbi:MAG: hypothetical protein NXI30_17110 [bacterium]|nr:hypothetical protein [bacterium]